MIREEFPPAWIEMGKIGEETVTESIPKGFKYFRNIYVPCFHGYDREEIDLVIIGRSGIWSIEIKNWRGIAYLGNYPDEIVFERNTKLGLRTSFRYNPYYQAKRHSEDLHKYFCRYFKSYFPSPQTLVVFVQKDINGINGVNLSHIRRSNPSIIYLQELKSVICKPGLPVIWDDWQPFYDLLKKLPKRTV